MTGRMEQSKPTIFVLDKVDITESTMFDRAISGADLPCEGNCTLRSPTRIT